METRTSDVFDVIVVGGGPVGLSATYEVAKTGAKVLVLEKNNFFNQAGSSNDLARMFRTMWVSLCNCTRRPICSRVRQ